MKKGIFSIPLGYTSPNLMFYLVLSSRSKSVPLKTGFKPVVASSVQTVYNVENPLLQYPDSTETSIRKRRKVVSFSPHLPTSSSNQAQPKPLPMVKPVQRRSTRSATRSRNMAAESQLAANTTEVTEQSRVVSEAEERQREVSGNKHHLAPSRENASDEESVCSSLSSVASASTTDYSPSRDILVSKPSKRRGRPPRNVKSRIPVIKDCRTDVVGINTDMGSQKGEIVQGKRPQEPPGIDSDPLMKKRRVVTKEATAQGIFPCCSGYFPYIVCLGVLFPLFFQRLMLCCITLLKNLQL